MRSKFSSLANQLMRNFPNIQNFYPITKKKSHKHSNQHMAKFGNNIIPNDMTLHVLNESNTLEPYVQ